MYKNNSVAAGWRFIAAAGLTMFAVQAFAQQTLLLSQPAISRIASRFVYAGDLWVANRDGKNPQRLTSHPASEFNPQFSPMGNGSRIRQATMATSMCM